MSRLTQSESGSASSSPDLPAAQFIANLSEQQLHHLQFSVPKKDEPERFSQFLEEPRGVPVPKRFTFAALDSAARVEEKSPVKHGRNESVKSVKSSMRTASEAGDSRISLNLKPSVSFMEKVETVVALDWKFYSTGACLCLLNLIAAWDVTTLSITLPTIAHGLPSSSFDTFWLSLSFLSAATIFLPLFSTFSAIFGRKAMLLTALAFFTIGSFIAAVTGKITGLHLGRTIQGIGAGGIYVLSSLIVNDLVSTVDRVKWTAILGATWAIGAVTGPLIGGSLAQTGQWRWIFWLNLPFCVTISLILVFVAELKPAPAGPKLSKLRNVDWLGFFLFTGSIIGVLLGLTWGGSLNAWSNFRTILPLQFGILGLLVFIVWSWFSPFPSLISLEGLLDPTHVGSYVGATVQGMIVYAGLYFLPIYFGVAKPSHSLITVGAHLCAWSVPIASFSVITFFVVTRSSLLRGATWFGWFLVVLGIALMTIYTRESEVVLWACVAVFSGVGLGMLYPCIWTAAISDAQYGPNGKDDDKLARAVTNLAFFQTLGATLGVAVSACVFQNRLLRELRLNPVLLDQSALRYVKRAFELVIRIRSLGAIEDTLKTQISASYVASIRPIWIVMAAFAGFAMFASLFLKKAERPRPQEPPAELRAIDPAYVV